MLFSAGKKLLRERTSRGKVKLRRAVRKALTVARRIYSVYKYLATLEKV